MIQLAHPQLWFVCGSQHLYGPEVIEQVGQHAREIAGQLDASAHLPLEVVSKGVLIRFGSNSRESGKNAEFPSISAKPYWLILTPFAGTPKVPFNSV